MNYKSISRYLYVYVPGIKIIPTPELFVEVYCLVAVSRAELSISLRVR